MYLAAYRLHTITMLSHSHSHKHNARALTCKLTRNHSHAPPLLSAFQDLCNERLKTLPIIFNYTGSFQNFTVPTGVNSLKMDVYGAEGGRALNGNGGGLGGYISSNVDVVPGQTLYLFVGEHTDLIEPWGVYAFNGGGQGADGFGAKGGGASDVRTRLNDLDSRIIVAGGGGGGGYAGVGGIGGGTIGGTASGTSCGANIGGYGGTQFAGGAPGGTYPDSGNANAGKGVGGSANWYGGGGGGGYYGGGGGGQRAYCYTNGAGGGGGSSYFNGSHGSIITNQQGMRRGNGLISINFQCLSVSSPSIPLPLTLKSIRFDYTGKIQNFTVPTNVFAVTADLRGAKGTNGNHGYYPGGLGGRVKATILVSPGAVYYVAVGGSTYLPALGSSYNGGGGGHNGGTGGGASDIHTDNSDSFRALSSRIIVAGGGAGSADGGAGGAGGGLIGLPGISFSMSYNTLYTYSTTTSKIYHQYIHISLLILKHIFIL